MPPPPRPLILLPGMGADARMYLPLRAQVPHLRVLRLREHRAGEPLPAYAARLATEIPDGAIVGGSSFGGMLAVQMALIRPVHAVLLIGSAPDPARIPLMALAGTMRLLPEAALGASASPGWLAGLGFGFGEVRQAAMFRRMLAATPSGFVRWAVAALRGAEPIDRARLDALPGGWHAIHGTRDRIIPIRTQPHAVRLPGAGHLPALTHPRAVAAWLRPLLETR